MKRWVWKTWLYCAAGAACLIAVAVVNDVISPNPGSQAFLIFLETFVAPVLMITAWEFGRRAGRREMLNQYRLRESGAYHNYEKWLEDDIWRWKLIQEDAMKNIEDL